MASGRKRRGPVKGRTMGLQDFLAMDEEVPPGYTVVHSKVNTGSWADSMEATSGNSDVKKIILPTGSKAIRGVEIDTTALPDKPPFTAYLGNLPFDVTENDVSAFFKHLDIVCIRLPKNAANAGRTKGFGYCEFGSRAALQEALRMTGDSIKGRKVHVSVVEKEDSRRAGRPYQQPTKHQPRSEDSYTKSDWRSASSGPPPLRRGFRRFDHSAERNDDHPSDSANWRATPRNGADDSSNNRFNNNNNNRRYGFNNNDNSGNNNNNLSNNNNNAYRNFGWRRRNDNDPYVESETATTAAERPKIQLARRTLPPQCSNATTTETPISSSIFGGAKPVDTAAREREIERKLQQMRVEDSATEPAWNGHSGKHEQEPNFDDCSSPPRAPT